jgi:hypothetical protein
MRSAWQLAASQTVDLGWDQLILLEDRRGSRVALFYGHVFETNEWRAREQAATAGDAK